MLIHYYLLSSNWFPGSALHCKAVSSRFDKKNRGFQNKLRSSCKMEKGLETAGDWTEDRGMEGINCIE